MSTIKINIEELKSDKASLEKYLDHYTISMEYIKDGLNYMKNGLDEKNLALYHKQMQSLLLELAATENHLLWGVKIIDECINKYQSVDATLTKYANEMYDDKGNIVPPKEITTESIPQESEQTIVKTYNGKEYYTLNIKDDYPDQAPNQCHANGVKISTDIMGMSRGREKAGLNYETMASDILSGKPVMFHFLHDNSGGQHWLVAVGVKKGSTPPYSVNDFLFVDTYDGKTKDWSAFSRAGSWYKNARPASDMQRYI